MTGRVFNKISPALWASSRFHSLSYQAKTAFVYFCTNAHVTSAGCYVLPDGYACTDLRCDIESYRAMRAEVLGAAMIDVDVEHSVVLIEKWFKHNPPTNDKYAIGTRRRVAEIPSERLRKKAEAALNEVDEARVARQSIDKITRDAQRAGKELDIQASLGSDSHLTNSDYMRRRGR